MQFFLILVLAACGGSASVTTDGSVLRVAEGENASVPVSAAPDWTSTDVAALHEQGGTATIVDVRTPEEFASGHVPGAKNIPLGELPSRFAEIPMDGPVHVVCHSGGRSARASELLASKGYAAINVTGGTQAWIQAGYEVE